MGSSTTITPYRPRSTCPAESKCGWYQNVPARSTTNRAGPLRVPNLELAHAPLQPPRVEKVDREEGPAALPATGATAVDRAGPVDNRGHLHVEVRDELVVDGVQRRSGQSLGWSVAALHARSGNPGAGGPGARAVIRRPTTNTVTAPTTLYQRKAMGVSWDTRKTAPIPASRP